jgi:hypothetical protein
MNDRAYELSDLVGTYTRTHEAGVKLETPVEEPWYDEDAMIAYMLLDEVLWTRSAHYTGNKDSQYEFHGKGTIVLLGCNDVFAWGCSDSEELQHDKVPELFMLWHENHRWGPAKWCCIKRNEKPQRPVEKAMREVGIWDAQMDALPENQYDKVCRDRAAAETSRAKGGSE